MQGFFRRMLKEQLHKKFICTNGENCEIASTNRTNCKFCRFAKCLSVGMNLEGLWTVQCSSVICLIFDIVHLNKHNFFDISTTTTRDHQFKIYKRFNSCSVRSLFFCEWVVNIWNRLPVDSTDLGSLRRFRNSLDAVDETILVDAQWVTLPFAKMKV